MKLAERCKSRQVRDARRIAAEGVLFENASAHAPWTLPFVASILTALHPAQHRAGGAWPQFTSLDPSVETLPGLFRQAGYETAAVINVVFLGPEFGLTRGTSTWTSRPPTTIAKSAPRARRRPPLSPGWLTSGIVPSS
jgi:hypothetical protein